MFRQWAFYSQPILHSFAVVPEERKYIGCVAFDVVTSVYISSTHRLDLVFQARSRLSVSNHTVHVASRIPTISTSLIFSSEKVCPLRLWVIRRP